MNSGKHLASFRTDFALLRPFHGPAIITVLTALAGAAGDHGRALLRYDRAALAAGELWRLVTAHIVHLGAGHLLLNTGGLVALAFVLRPLRPTASWWFMTGLLSAAAVDVGLWWLEPGVDWYVGMSGVLHGFWAAGGSALMVSHERREGWAVIGLLLVKLGYERWEGHAGFSEILSGGDVISTAHVYGAAGGLCAVALIGIVRKHRAQTRDA